VKSNQVTAVSVSGTVAFIAAFWGLAVAQAPSGVYYVFLLCTAIAVTLSARFFASAKKVAAESTNSEDYRRLIDEYRRLADLAITAQEHTDLKLGDMSVRIDHLMGQMSSLQTILKEVE
jgi:hypothetical protein